MFWTAAQAFNFYFLPSYLRVVYMCVMAGIFDAFLSFMKYEVNCFFSICCSTLSFPCTVNTTTCGLIAAPEDVL